MLSTEEIIYHVCSVGDKWIGETLEFEEEELVASSVVLGSEVANIAATHAAHMKDFTDNFLRKYGIRSGISSRVEQEEMGQLQQLQQHLSHMSNTAITVVRGSAVIRFGVTECRTAMGVVNLLNETKLVSLFFQCCVLIAANMCDVATTFYQAEIVSSMPPSRSPVPQYQRTTHITVFRSDFEFRRGCDVARLLHKNLETFRTGVWKFEFERLMILFTNKAGCVGIDLASLYCCAMDEESSGCMLWVDHVTDWLQLDSRFAPLAARRGHLDAPDNVGLFVFVTFHDELHTKGAKFISMVFQRMGLPLTIVAHTEVPPVPESGQQVVFRNVPSVLANISDEPATTVALRDAAVLERLGTCMAQLTGVPMLEQIFGEANELVEPLELAVRRLLLVPYQAGSAYRVMLTLGFSNTFLSAITGGSTSYFLNMNAEKCVRVLLCKALVRLRGAGVRGAAELVKLSYALLDAGADGFPAQFAGNRTGVVFDGGSGAVFLHTGDFVRGHRQVINAVRQQMTMSCTDFQNCKRYFHGTSWAHAHTIASEGIDPTCGRVHCDFGLGFYASENLKFAAKWACANHTQPAVIMYVVPGNWLDGVNKCEFDSVTDDWRILTEFCRNTRRSRREIVNKTKEYAGISGPIVANPLADVFDHVMYDGRMQFQTCIVADETATILSDLRKCIVYFPENATADDLSI